MTDTTPQARRVMAAGGEWQAGMLDEDGDRVVRLGDGTLVTAGVIGPHVYAHDGFGVCPNLSDPATCAVLEAQAVARMQALFPGYSVRITRIHEGDETLVDWCISSSQHSGPLLAVTALEIRALVYVFEWLASLEATNAQD